MSEFLRSELGEDLEIVMLEMTGEEQEERIRIRHEGSQDAVDLMKVGWDCVVDGYMTEKPILYSNPVLQNSEVKGSPFLKCVGSILALPK